MKTKTTILTLILLFGSTLLFSQKDYLIEFTYDDAGNRTERNVIEFSKDDNPGTKTPDKSAFAGVFTEKAGDMQVTIYPNPVKEKLTVEIEGGTGNETTVVELFSLSGESLIRKRKVRNRSKLNLSNLPAGTYILKILSGKDVSTWKIIKR